MRDELAFGRIGGVVASLNFGLTLGLLGVKGWLLITLTLGLLGWLLNMEGGLGLMLTFGLINGGLIGLFYGVIFGLNSGLDGGPGSWLVLGYVLGCALVGGLGWGLFSGLIFVLYSGLRSGIDALLEGFTVGKIETKSFPNEGIRRSVRYAFITGLAGGPLSGLAGVLYFGLRIGWDKALLFGLISAPLGGLIFGLRFGGHACLHHLALRLVLWLNNFAPLNYIRFLDYATAWIFLCKVDGRYVFRHGMVQEYFAASAHTTLKTGVGKRRDLTDTSLYEATVPQN